MAQTKEETEAWIIKQSELNPQEIKHNIEDDVFISKVTMVNGIGGLGGEPVEKGIPISQITNIVYNYFWRCA